jgi:hypothetical protein
VKSVLRVSRAVHVIAVILDAFLVTADADVAAQHLPFAALADAAGVDAVLAAARAIAAAMLDPGDACPFTFNAYLRAFVMSAPVLPYDLILVDEAQDVNPITARLLTAQTAAAKVFVGDPHQHIYAFNGTRNALAALPADATFRLTRSFRFGADLAALADKLLFMKGERVPLRGGRGCVTTLRAASTPTTLAAPPRVGRRWRPKRHVGGSRGARGGERAHSARGDARGCAERAHQDARRVPRVVRPRRGGRLRRAAQRRQPGGAQGAMRGER